MNIKRWLDDKKAFHKINCDNNRFFWDDAQSRLVTITTPMLMMVFFLLYLVIAGFFVLVITLFLSESEYRLLQPLSLLPPILFILVSIPIFYILRTNSEDYQRYKFAKGFYKSAWWENTQITPQQIVYDKGLRGEYISTMALEECLRKNKIYGKILNNVVINGQNNDFTEADIVAVTEKGIFVVEAKNRSGIMTGYIDEPKWTQQLETEKK